MQNLPSLDTQDMWQRLKEEKRPIVIYGMGNGADKLISRLSSLGISFADIFASDGFVRGHSFHGVRIKSFSEIKDTYSDFVILLSFGAKLDDVIKMLEEIDKSYDMYVPDMPVSEETVYFDSVFYREHYSKIVTALETLCDEESKNTFISLIRYKLSGRMADLLAFTHTKEEMYKLIIEKNPRKYCDVGAYNGDTLKEALHHLPSISRAVCIEPDKKTFKRLLKYAEGVDNASVACINAAAWSACGEGDFSASASRNSSISGVSTSSFEHKNDEVSLVSVDSLGEDFDYVKYDVEGAEREALDGSSETIDRCRPALLVSLYHKSRDIFELINLLREKYQGYKFYLRRLRCLPAWEINLIMIPT